MATVKMISVTLRESNDNDLRDVCDMRDADDNVVEFTVCAGKPEIV